MNAQDVWQLLNKQEMLDEDGKDWKVGNAVMNFARDMESLKEEERNKVLKMIIDLYGDGSVAITNDPANWAEITDGLWQSINDPTMFSTDGGKTYYSCNDPEHRIHTSIPTGVPVNEAEPVEQ